MRFEPVTARRAVRFVVIALAAFCPLASTIGAAGLPVRPPARVGAVADANGSTSVLGVAWNADNSPIPGAHVQLRNLVTGKVEGATAADHLGQFTFKRVEGGTYTVELVASNGRIVTVGHAFVIAPGETVATFVRLGAKVPWFSGFFGNAAAAVAAAAASQGITALAPVQLPSSPGGGR